MTVKVNIYLNILQKLKVSSFGALKILRYFGNMKQNISVFNTVEATVNDNDNNKGGSMETTFF